MIKRLVVLPFFVLSLFTACEDEEDPRFHNDPSFGWSEFAGAWETKEECAQAGKFEYTTEIVVPEGVSTLVRIKNLFEINQSLDCIIMNGDSCKLDSSSRINGFPVEGTMVLNDSRTSATIKYDILGTAPENCEAKLTR